MITWLNARTPTTLNITLNNNVNINIVVQNVGGFRGECRMGSGPKSAILRQIVTRQTDFLILTETKTKKSQIFQNKNCFQIKPKLATSQEGVKLGVAIYANDKYTLIKDSVHESNIPGHYIVAVFRNKNFHIIVAGVYGPSDHSDSTSMHMFQQLNEDIILLKQLYEIQSVLVAGDFNLALHETDSSSGKLLKPRATESLHELIDAHQLFDTAQRQHPVEHTWHRRGMASQSSRLDYVLTSTSLENVNYSMKFTINAFDHATLKVRIGKPEMKKPAMKDYILGKEEFIIEMSEEIKTFREKFTLSSCNLLQDGGGEETDDLDFQTDRPPCG